MNPLLAFFSHLNAWKKVSVSSVAFRWCAKRWVAGSISVAGQDTLTLCRTAVSFYAIKAPHPIDVRFHVYKALVGEKVTVNSFIHLVPRHSE